MAVASIPAGVHEDFAAGAAPAHRMADATVRRRTGLVAAILLAVAWAVVSLVGNPGGFYTQEELPYVSGLPIAPPQIQRRIAPQAPPGFDLSRSLDELQNGTGAASPQPSP